MLALPIWNFILPIYSFWHFDDFTWGETRKVNGGDVNNSKSRKIEEEADRDFLLNNDQNKGKNEALAHLGKRKTDYSKTREIKANRLS